jgi:tryptophan 2,3-dioxygenase
MPPRSHRKLTLPVKAASGDAVYTFRMSYSDYLRLPQLLDCQRPLTAEHDELLFVIVHQTSELWLKLCVHELRAVLDRLRADDLEPAFKMLARVGRLQHHLIETWETLTTMTPADYLRFRDALGASSGLQSHQYRLLEMLLGLKDPAKIAMHRNDPAVFAELDAVLGAPSLYDETLRLLARRGFDIPAELQQRDWTTPYEASERVEAAWLRVYHAVDRYWDLYELAEKLVDVEYRFHQWRFAHVQTVERVIGFRGGTGGSSGVPYLLRSLERRFFPELFSLRTKM